MKHFLACRADGPAAIFSHIFKHESRYAGWKITSIAFHFQGFEPDFLVLIPMNYAEEALSKLCPAGGYILKSVTAVMLVGVGSKNRAMKNRNIVLVQVGNWPGKDKVTFSLAFLFCLFSL